MPAKSACAYDLPDGLLEMGMGRSCLHFGDLDPNPGYDT